MGRRGYAPQSRRRVLDLVETGGSITDVARDVIGLDTTMAVVDSLYTEFKEQLFGPPPLLSRMVDAGLLRRKPGRGFFEFDTGGGNR